MLIHTGENGWVEWYNNVLTQEAAAAYLDENTVWLDISLPAIPPHKDGFVPRLRLTEEKTLTYDYEPRSNQRHWARICLSAQPSRL